MLRLITIGVLLGFGSMIGERVANITLAKLDDIVDTMKEAKNKDKA